MTNYYLTPNFGIPCGKNLKLSINYGSSILFVKGHVAGLSEVNDKFLKIVLFEDLAGKKAGDVLNINFDHIIIWEELEENIIKETLKTSEPAVYRVPILSERDTTVSQEIIPSLLSARRL